MTIRKVNPLLLGAAAALALLAQIPQPSPFQGGGGSGGGGSITFGAYASLPSSTGQSTGSVYQTTDSPFSFIFATGAWNAFMPKYGLVVPPGTLTTTWVNQASATIDQTNGIALVAQASGAGSAHNWALRTMAIPTASSPYTLTAVIGVRDSTRTSSSNNRAGIAIRDSVSGKFIALDFDWATAAFSELSVLAWTNPTTYGGTTYQQTRWTDTTGGGSGNDGFPAEIVLRIKNDGTNVTYYASNDGVHFVQIYQHAKNTFVTPTDVAFGVSNYSVTLDMYVYSFALTQP
jgi:hypothetical protein